MYDVRSSAITEEHGMVRQKPPVSMALGQSHCYQLCCFSSPFCSYMVYPVIAEAEWQRISEVL